MAVNSIFFINDRHEDREALFSAIDASVKWFVLDSSLGGITHMQRILSSYHDLDSVQIISQGSSEPINVGGTIQSSTTVYYSQTQLKDIGTSLNKTGNLLLYECDVAEGEEGQKLIKKLAKVTAGDFAASNSLTLVIFVFVYITSSANSIFKKVLHFFFTFVHTGLIRNAQNYKLLLDNSSYRFKLRM